MLQRINDRQRFLLLLLIMAGVAVAAAGLSIVILYHAAFAEQQARLTSMVESQARLIESVARFNADFNETNPSKGANAAVLVQVVNAQNQYVGFGKTGEFALARRSVENIETLLTGRTAGQKPPGPIPFDAAHAEPMRQALLGFSGTLEGLDYRGVRVLAAYEPISFLNWGLVAKMDLAEIRAPFIKAGVISGIGALIVVAFGAFLFQRVSSPILENLKTTVAKLANAQRIASIGNWDLNLSTGEFWWSDETYRIFGLEPGQFKTDSFLDLVHPDDRQKVDDAVRRACEEKSTYVMNYRVVQPNGSIRIVHAHGEPVIGDKSRSLRMTGTLQDITERKQAEEALRDSEERFRALLDNAPQSICLKDLEGRFLLVNRNFAQRVGIPAEDIRGKTSYDLFPKEQSNADTKQDRDVVETGRAVSIEVPLPYQNGEQRTGLTVKFPVFGADGTIVALGGCPPTLPIVN